MTEPATDEQIEPVRKLLEEPDCRVLISMHVEGTTDTGTETRDRLRGIIARIEAETARADAASELAKTHELNHESCLVLLEAARERIAALEQLLTQAKGGPTSCDT